MNPKQIAGEKAVESVEDGMLVGLGTGSTSYFAIQRIGQRVQEGLKIRAVASSEQSEQLAKQWEIPIIPFSEVSTIDLYIDGADEVDAQHNLIKGGGGALLREKVLASASSRFIVIVDETKKVSRLGQFPLPVEIVPFAHNLTIDKLAQFPCELKIRQENNKNYLTDNGNLIVDCHFGSIADPARICQELNRIPGVVENGLFIQLASAVVIGHGDGSVTIEQGKTE